MSKTKFLTSILLAMAVLFAQVGIVAAAPAAQEGTTTTISGTINEITTDLDENGETIVIVTLTDDLGATQIITLSAEEAADNKLFDLTTQELLVQSGEAVELIVDPTDVVPDEQLGGPDVHPISMLLAKFFFNEDTNMTNEMASLIDSFHNGDNEELDQVYGFGVIAQALWMSKNVNEGTADADLAQEILLAKKSGDYSQIELPEGFTWPNDTAPTNWGQFKKAIKGLNENKEKQNLGTIVSEQPEDGTGTEDPALQENPGQQNQGNDKHDKQDKQKVKKLKKK